VKKKKKILPRPSLSKLMSKSKSNVGTGVTDEKVVYIALFKPLIILDDEKTN
jgi:hypothetical protein